MTSNSNDVWWNQSKYWFMPKPPELSDERPNIPAIIQEAQRLERKRCLSIIEEMQLAIKGVTYNYGGKDITKELEAYDQALTDALKAL